MKIYVFAVKLDEPNLYEVFERVAITEYQKMYDRWEKGFSEGNVSLIRNTNIEKISIGSTWDGENFIFNENQDYYINLYIKTENNLNNKEYIELNFE